jgi:tetratricopeptide (TPR) repeat protein
MAKRKKKRQGGPSPQRSSKPTGTKFQSGIEKAEALLRRKQFDAAREELQQLNRRYPHNKDVLSLLSNLALEQQDMQHYQYYIEQLSNLEPDDPELVAALVGAYMMNVRPAQGLRTIRRYLEQWPEHEQAAEMRKHAAELEEELTDFLSEHGLMGAEGLELAALHEQVGTYLEQHDMKRALEIAHEFLQRKPDFPPVLNNVSQAYYAEGKLEQAIETAQQALALDADNMHALSNMTRYLCMQGRPEEAQEWAEHLKTLKPDNLDHLAKQAEALSFLGDDEGVLAVFQAAQEQDMPQRGQNMALLYHLAAVATMRQGDEKEAQRLWKQALKVAPWFALARDNLEDARKPAGQRHAPWPFSLGEWLSESRIQAMAAPIERLAKSSKANDSRSLTKQVQRWLQNYPEMVKVLPMLLDRGDPMGREFALRVAIEADHPELHEALHDFALSPRGPDADRNRAANTAREADLLPAGMIKMWLKGEQREVMLMGFEITGEPEHKHNPKTAQLAADAAVALSENRPEDSEALLLQALKLEPDAPDLKNNLAMAYALQGDNKRAEAMIREIHQQHPDYFFATISVARMHTREGELEEARALLESLLTRKRFHTSEFVHLCEAEIEFWMAKGEKEGAHSWLNLWEQVDPENPRLISWKARMKAPKLLQKLMRWR